MGLQHPVGDRNQRSLIVDLHLRLTSRLHRGLTRATVRIVLILADSTKVLLGQTEVQRIHESGSIEDANQHLIFAAAPIAS
jgi:hypothetical protein